MGIPFKVKCDYSDFQKRWDNPQLALDIPLFFSKEDLDSLRASGILHHTDYHYDESEDVEDIDEENKKDEEVHEIAEGAEYAHRLIHGLR